MLIWDRIRMAAAVAAVGVAAGGGAIIAGEIMVERTAVQPPDAVAAQPPQAVVGAVSAQAPAPAAPSSEEAALIAELTKLGKERRDMNKAAADADPAVQAARQKLQAATEAHKDFYASHPGIKTVKTMPEYKPISAALSEAWRDEAQAIAAVNARVEQEPEAKAIREKIQELKARLDALRAASKAQETAQPAP